ncbi:hypothetical protein [uncultured Ruegeria sp.]|uniref:hypothetical protein n=1 Tax=uncultured Ruegeria sp. TaxID=259304 RepID=UPI00262575F8|nr:hypothetical protein [uncultured Ruegeria sp.]
MRVFRLQYPALAALAMSVCLCTAFRATADDAATIMVRLGETAGNVMEMPDGRRFVIYLPLKQIWEISATGFVMAAADVEMQSGSDGILTLYWDDGEVHEVDLAEIEDLTFLEETPEIITQLDQIVGQPLPSPVGPLPAGAQLAEAGAVFFTNDVIGDWSVIGRQIWYRPVAGQPDLIDPVDLVAALTVSDEGGE